MVNRLGKRIWSASNTAASTIVAEMKYAIASDITIIDTDGDRNADRLYVGDVGGQVWRVDFDDVNSVNGFKVTQLADFDNGSPQRFFYAPSIALTGSGKNSYFSVALGSGDRTNPLNSSARNALFMLKDPDVETGAPSSKPGVVAVSQLYDATVNRIGSNDEEVAKAAKEALSKAKGWMVRLVDGEKSLSRLVTFENRLMATTFREADDGSDCGVGIDGRFYMMDVATAQPLAFANSDDDDGSSETDDANDSENSPNANPLRRFRTIKTRGIPSAPLILFPQDGSTVQVMVDRQTVDIFDQKLATIFWHSRLYCYTASLGLGHHPVQK